MTPPNDDKSIEALEAIFQDAALADAEEESLITPEDREWADGVRSRMQARIAEARRNLLPATVTPAAAKPIRPTYLAMTRDALLAALEGITRRMGGAVQVAHRNLSDLTDNDLRRLLETLNADPE